MPRLGKFQRNVVAKQAVPLDRNGHPTWFWDLRTLKRPVVVLPKVLPKVRQVPSA